MSDVFTDPNGWLVRIDGSGNAWRYDYGAKAWLRYARYDLPDKEAK